jgi:hypothetical protein
MQLCSWIQLVEQARPQSPSATPAAFEVAEELFSSGIAGANARHEVKGGSTSERPPCSG